jgi:hypothetical protein
MARIGWMALELRAVGNTDQIGTKRTRPGLDIVRGERLFERRNHLSADRARPP